MAGFKKELPTIEQGLPNRQREIPHEEEPWPPRAWEGRVIPGGYPTAMAGGRESPALDVEFFGAAGDDTDVLVLPFRIGGKAYAIRAGGGGGEVYLGLVQSVPSNSERTVSVKQAEVTLDSAGGIVGVSEVSGAGTIVCNAMIYADSSDIGIGRCVPQLKADDSLQALVEWTYDPDGNPWLIAPWFMAVEQYVTDTWYKGTIGWHSSAGRLYYRRGNIPKPP